jgi:hypothetical protein
LRSHLKDNPSLKAKVDEALDEAYELAVIGVARETGLPEGDFPRSLAIPLRTGDRRPVLAGLNGRPARLRP